MTNELIMYFSRSGDNYVNGSVKKLTVGNTEVAANILQKMTGTELFKIEPIKKYSADYYVCIDEAKQDLQRGARPKLETYPDNLNEVDVLYLGYPNYWGTMPVAVFTLLGQYDFTGKTIMPFCTHEGSGMGKSENDLRQICPTATIKTGLPIKGSEVRKSYELFGHWIRNVMGVI